MTGHYFEAGACVYCGCDDHDEAADRPCRVEREPVRFTTETPR